MSQHLRGVVFEKAQGQAAFLGHRLEQFDGIARQIGQRQCLPLLARCAGFGLGNVQQGVDHLLQGFQFAPDGLQILLRIGIRAFCRRFQCLARVHQRDTQIVCDGVDHGAQSAGQILDALQHRVDGAGKSVEFVIGQTDCQSLLHLASGDARGGRGHGIDPFQQSPTGPPGAADHHGGHQQQAQAGGPEHGAAAAQASLDIAPHQQRRIIRESADQGAGGVLFPAGQFQIETDQCRCRGDARKGDGDIASQQLPLPVPQRVQCFRIYRQPGAFVDGIDERAGPAIGKDLVQAQYLFVQRRMHFAVGDRHRLHVHQTDGDGRDRAEQGDVKQGGPGRSGGQRLAHAHAGNSRSLSV